MLLLLRKESGVLDATVEGGRSGLSVEEGGVVVVVMVK
jgi:hypothetical protein